MKIISLIVLVLIGCQSAISQVDLQSSHLPIFVINTLSSPINDSTKTTAKLEVFYNDGGINNVSDPNPHYDGFIGIEYRGSSSLRFPKKSYNIETRDDSGEDEDFALLGMPPESDWVLYAPYSDKTLLRNLLAYHLFGKLNRYSPRTKFCELIVDSDYHGVYLLVEKIKRDKNRVDVTKQDKEINALSDISGGYILQIDRNDSSGWYSAIAPPNAITDRTYYQVRYPNNNLHSSQRDYIKNIVNNFENSLTVTEISFPDVINQVDLNSFVDFIIINEFAKNVDAYRLSTYLHKDSDDKDSRIKFGPAWDFNIAFGNADYYQGDKTSNWQLYVNYVDQYMPPFWFEKLLKSVLAEKILQRRWKELRSGFFSVDSINEFVDQNVTLLGEAIIRNFTRWNILGVKVWPNPDVRFTYESEIGYLKQWLENRIQWIDNSLNKNYIYVDWADTVNLISNNNTIILPKSRFYNSDRTIDSVKVFSFSRKLFVEDLIDSVALTTSGTEIKNFVAVAFKDGDVFDVSPTYSIGGSVTSVAEEKPVKSYHLAQNYPNPFNPITTIEYSIPRSEAQGRKLNVVTLKVYDLLGREVETLVDKRQGPGKYKVEWDTSSESERISSGVYFYRLLAGNYSSVKKMVLLR